MDLLIDEVSSNLHMFTIDDTFVHTFVFQGTVTSSSVRSSILLIFSGGGGVCCNEQILTTSDRYIYAPSVWLSFLGKEMLHTFILLVHSFFDGLNNRGEGEAQFVLYFDV